MKWALVIWLYGSSSGDFTVYERFVNLDDCLSKKQTVSKSLTQVNSQMRVVCRPIEVGGQRETKNIIVQRYVIN
jgi:hypothetical protein